VFVIDATSRDDIATIARRTGLRVAQESVLLSEYGPAQGKGDAMWRGPAATDSEIVAFPTPTPRTSPPSRSQSRALPVCERRAWVERSLER